MDISNKKGFGTIDVLFALGIMGLMIGGYARQESENYSHRRADSIANSVSSVMDATKFYIGNNYNALLSHLNVGQSMEIPLINNPDFMGIGDLATNSALLPSGFTGKVAKGQTLHLIVKHMAQSEGKPDYLSGMVMTTGGANLTDREVGLAVNEMGLSGGGVMSKPPIGHTSGSVYGGYGTWSYPVTQWQVSGVTPSVGHIAMVTDSFALPTGDYLSRYNGSNPEGVRLHTDLDMGNGEGGMSGNQLNGVHAIFGANNQDTRLQDTYHSGRVNFGNGGIACANDSMGCHFDIGTKGGFYDNEDGWISMNSDNEIAIPADPNDPADRPVSKAGLRMAHRGRKLRMTRTGLGLTQEAFAGFLGVSPVELLAWEQVRQEIPEDIMSKAQAIKKGASLPKGL